MTIFSAPNYCDTYRNKGAVAYINDVIFLLNWRIKYRFIVLVKSNILMYLVITWTVFNLRFQVFANLQEKCFYTCLKINVNLVNLPWLMIKYWRNWMPYTEFKLWRSFLKRNFFKMRKFSKKSQKEIFLKI